MGMLRRAVAPLGDLATYRRWLYLVLGGVLFFPFLMAAAVMVSLVQFRGVPAGSASLGWSTTVVAFVLAALMVAALAQVRGMPQLQVRLARALLGGPLAEQPLPPADSPPARARAAAWLTGHFTVGFGAALATMIVLTEAGTLVFAPVAVRTSTILLPQWLVAGDRAWLGPFVAAGELVVTGFGVALVGAATARLAARVLGPSAAERLAAARAAAERLGERTRIATELHDSIGHVLSVVTLQAGTAARLIDSDPEFARSALHTIAEQARTAVDELDHVLGLLREERTTEPRRDLAQLEELVDSARAAGAEVRLELLGGTDAVPGVVSREAYRLAQEGLTNALRHGATPIAVRLEVDDGRLRLRIANPLPRRRTARRAGGRGLRGMADRVAMLGGTLTVGPDDGEWRLSARIPWKEDQ